MHSIYRSKFKKAISKVWHSTGFFLRVLPLHLKKYKYCLFLFVARRIMTSVLPEPGPAMTSKGPLSWVMACFCSGVRVLSSMVGASDFASRMVVTSLSGIPATPVSTSCCVTNWGQTPFCDIGTTLKGFKDILISIGLYVTFPVRHFPFLFVGAGQGGCVLSKRLSRALKVLHFCPAKCITNYTTPAKKLPLKYSIPPPCFTKWGQTPVCEIAR